MKAQDRYLPSFEIWASHPTYYLSLGRNSSQSILRREGVALMSLVKRHPLISFFVLAYALSWWPWVLYALDLSPQPIVGFGPFLAAIVVLLITCGKTGIVGLLRRMVRWRVGLRWYAVALLLPVAITLAAAAFNVLLGAQAPSADELGGWTGLF